MGQEPDEIRRQIEHTRDEMGDTIDALGYKADVPARAKDRITDTVDRARESITGTVDSVKGAVSGTAASVRDAAPDSGQVSGQARRAVGVAQENPLGLVIGAVAVGFLVGMIMPTTRMEDERLGPVADQVKDQAADVGREALEHGKQIASETAQTAMDAAKDSAQHHGDDLRASAEEHAQTAMTGAGEGFSQFPQR